jgi:hypothetical protein
MIYKDIAHVNWAAMSDKATSVVKDLNMEGSFLVPALLALVASQMPPVKEGTKYSFKATMINIITLAKAGQIKYPNGKSLSTDEVRGILNFLNAVPRGEVLGGAKQVDPKVTRYATGVPLMLSAYREYKDIKYSDWDYTCEHQYLCNFLDRDLLALVPYFGYVPEFTYAELLDYRAIGGTFKTGGNAGKIKSPNSITVINKVDNPDFDGLPKLLRLMLCQTWVYQPSIRSKYAITNISDLDAVAQDITGGLEVFKPVVETAGDSLWD